MENASKALILAAGVLIGILILSLMVYLFSSLTGVALEVQKENNQKVITQFNAEFVQYQSKENVTIYDVVSVKNYAKEINNNRNYDNRIKVYLSNKRGLNTEITSSGFTKSDQYLIGLDLNEEKKVKQIDEDGIERRTTVIPNYNVREIKYDENGKVNMIRFREK